MYINKLLRLPVGITALLLSSQMTFATEMLTPDTEDILQNQGFSKINDTKNLKTSAADTTQGFYIGLGTGYAIVSNSNLIKVYGNELNSQNMGDVTGSSTPVFVNIGYRFNQYVGTEITYNYSGNQLYNHPIQDTKATEPYFWGSQNTFALNTIGYLPIVDHLYLKGRIGVAYSVNTLTTYPGTPGTGSFTSVLGAGAQYFIGKSVSLDFDYINYGALAPMELKYHPPVGANNPPNLGTIDTIRSDQFLVSINYHF